MKIKLLTILLMLTFAAGTTFAGCGNDNGNGTENQSKTLSGTVKIITQTGAGADALSAMPDGYQVQSFKTKDEVVGQILNGSYDLAVVDPITAAKLYNQTGGELVAISPIALDDWHVVSNNRFVTEERITSLSGKTIASADQDGTGYAILRQLLEDQYINPDYRITMDWVGTTDRAIAALKTTGSTAMLPQTDVAKALEAAGSGDTTSDIDLSQLWETAYGYPIPSDIVIASKQFVKKRSDDLGLFLETVTGSIDKAKKSSTSNLVFYNSSRGMEILKNDMAALNDLALLGGKAPGTAFYYGIGE